MNKSTLSTAAAFVTALATIAMTAAIVNCDKDDKATSTPAQVAHKGEACQSTNDCAPGLACLPLAEAINTSSSSTVSLGSGGICVLGVFSVAQTAKECAIIECQAATDCCANPPDSCTALKQSCDLSVDAGFPNNSACTTYTQECVCDPAQHDCQNGQCVTKCINDSTCTLTGVGGKCLGGVCGSCSSDDDCTKTNANNLCVSGKCQPKCQGDGDCANFDRCVGGKCTPGACQTDRECIAYSKNVEATCGTDGKCIVPCQTDLECGNPKDYGFYSCVGGKCTYMGCGNDKDCELALRGTTQQVLTIPTGTSSGSSGTSGSNISSSKEHIVCRDKQVPNPTTAPASQ